jgi:sugar transferase (PEP-CTERM system associated)
VKILNQHIPTPTVLLVLSETIMVMLSVYAGAAIRFFGNWAQLEQDMAPVLPKALIFGFFVIVGLAATGLYQAHYQRLSPESIVARIVAGLGLAALGLALVYFIFPVLALGRIAWVLSLTCAFILIALVRALAKRFLTDDTFRRRTPIYGAGEMASSLLKLRRRSDQQGFKIIAFVPAGGDRRVIDDERVLKEQIDIPAFVRGEQIDEIVIAMDDRRRGFPIRELLECKFAGVDVIDLLGFLERESGRVNVELMNPSWLVFSDGFTRKASRQVSSRILDIVASIALLFVSLPIMLLVAILILLEDGRPILYRQVRVGLLDSKFELLKFRSMSVGAESDGEARWAQPGDDRVTRVGSWIRKFRFDELPQIFNILRGDMSLVGPRPERPEFVSQLTETIPYYQERYCVKPGLTGWAQLRYPYGASERDSLEKLCFDLYYVKNQSFLLDLVILLQTAEVIIWRKGAR